MRGVANVPPFSSDDSRRRDVIAFGRSGLDYIDVRNDLRTLVVGFFGPLPADLGREHFTIEGGERVVGIAVTSVRTVADDAEQEGALAVRVDRTGDASTYTLRVVGVPDVDPLYASLTFTFDASERRPTDCETARPPVVPMLPAPHIDYLAKDYATFRRALLDRAALVVPQWRERHAADLGVTLVEVLAFVGDRFSYFQDAVATEAYLGTARKRISVRRHARLLDYVMHEGCNARAFLVLDADVDVPPLDPRELVFSTVATPDTPARYFEPLGREAIHVYAAHAPMRPYAWGNATCSLDLGATSATLRDAWEESAGEDEREPLRALRHLEAGDYVLFENVRRVARAAVARPDPARRHVVRLTHVRRAVDPLYVVPVVEIAWAVADRLPFAFEISAPDPSDPTAPPLELGVVWGNVIVVDHGRTLGPSEIENLTAVPLDATGPYRPTLARADLTFAERSAAEGANAAALARRRPREARPGIVELISTDLEGHERAWHPAPDLLTSGENDARYVVEVDELGVATLRFGDGILGRKPAAGATFRARYRVGGGLAGNVGAETIVRIASTAGGALPAALHVRNPLPASGGASPESVDDVRALAPSAFRADAVRAIVPEDYARIAERDERVARAAAEFRWTGSRTLVRVALDPLHVENLDPAIAADVAARLESVRRIGHDVDVVSASYVSLALALRVTVADGYQRGHVLAALESALGSVVAADGTIGFFHPDNLTFGDSIAQSRIVARVLAVAGVRDVVVTRFERLAIPTPNVVPATLAFGSFEIARLDGDAARPERGTLSLDLRGGR